MDSWTSPSHPLLQPLTPPQLTVTGNEIPDICIWPAETFSHLVAVGREELGLFLPSPNCGDLASFPGTHMP